MSEHGPLLPMRQDEPRVVIRWWIVLACLAVNPISTSAIVAGALLASYQERKRPPRGYR